MTIEDRKIINLGSGYWGEYVRVMGYSFYPTDIGLRKLSRLLDLNIQHLRKSIIMYLENN